MADIIRNDERLAGAVSERLAEDRLLDARGIEVSVQGGRVTLQGTVPHAADAALAELIAAGTAGVEAVDNRLAHVAGPSSADSLGETEESPHYEGRWGRWTPPLST